MARRSSKVYVIGRECFVPHPLLAGLWIRTDLSVIKVACSYPGCGSPTGVPCRSTAACHRDSDPPHYGSSTHYYRRRDAKTKGRDWKNLQLIIVKGEP